MSFGAVPEYDTSGVLPTFVGADAVQPSARSPYRVTVQELVRRFAYTKERAKLLLGLNAYRQTLFSRGFTQGMQWIDGSFVEDVERTRGRPPKDIDLVTLFRRPLAYTGKPAVWKADFRNTIFPALFDVKSCKASFHCDTYPIDLESDSESLIAQSNYWLGLFSEQRNTKSRKGIVAIPLPNDAFEFTAISAMIRGMHDV